MHQIHGISMNITVNRERLLEKLKENRARHVKIVQEANDNFYTEVARKLEAKLDAVRTAATAGEKPRLIALSVQPPVDHTGEYDTVITMLEYHTGETIQLTPDEARNLLEDRWDWMRVFLETNAAYSKSARALGE